MSTPTRMHPLFAALLRAAPSKPTAGAAPAARPKAAAAAPAKPKGTTKPKPAARTAVSHAASASVRTSDFSHLLPARAPEPPASPAASSGTRKPAPMSHEQAAQTAGAIIAANNKRLGVSSDADKAQAQAQAQANMTPLAKQIVAVAKRVGLA